jgi:hypothetical protein
MERARRGFALDVAVLLARLGLADLDAVAVPAEPHRATLGLALRAHGSDVGEGLAP